MALFAMAVPIPGGNDDKWKAFIAQLTGPRKAEFDASRKKLGVRERTFHQHTPMGDFVIVTLEGNDPEGAFTRFGQGTDAFTQWFKAQVKEVHGVDLSGPPPGPLPKQIIDSGA
jgi:hypothetical protein